MIILYGGHFWKWVAIRKLLVEFNIRHQLDSVPNELLINKDSFVLVVATAGHVDHGKSSLVRALTGVDPDRFAEEKSRGMTIDLGFASFSQNGVEVSFVDVPGHTRFIKNMLAGVGSMRTALFVVAATEGWKPQSEEHLRILELLNFEFGLIALTKIDGADPLLIELAQLEIAEATEGTFLSSAEVFPVDSITGTGIGALKARLLDRAVTQQRSAAVGPTRIWIDRAFSVRGSGTVVTGTLTGSSLSTGAQLAVAANELLPRPSSTKVGPRRFSRVLLDQRWTPLVRVRKLQSHGLELSDVEPDSRVAANLSGVDANQLSRGDALFDPSRWLLSATFDATITVLPKLGHAVNRKGSYSVHLGSAESSASIRLLDASTQLKPGETGLARIIMPRYFPIRPGDRFVLRESGRHETVGGGEILDVVVTVPATRARPSKDLLSKLKELQQIEIEHLPKFTETGFEIENFEFHRLSNLAVDQEFAVSTRASLTERANSAGREGLDLASLSQLERALAEASTDLEVIDSRLFHSEFASLARDVTNSPLLCQLEQAGLHPPDFPPKERSTLRQLVKAGLAVETGGTYFANSAVEEAKLLLYRLAEESPQGFTVSEVRTLLDTTRKYLVPLLEYFDRTGITRRDGDLRSLGPVGVRESNTHTAGSAEDSGGNSSA